MKKDTKYRIVQIETGEAILYKIEANYKCRFLFFHWWTGWTNSVIGEYKNYDLPMSSFDEAMDAIEDLRRTEKTVKKIAWEEK